jgi:hypothetical protein
VARSSFSYLSGEVQLGSRRQPDSGSPINSANQDVRLISHTTAKRQRHKLVEKKEAKDNREHRSNNNNNNNKDEQGSTKHE